jgi:hypothetical protein
MPISQTQAQPAPLRGREFNSRGAATAQKRRQQTPKPNNNKKLPYGHQQSTPDRPQQFFFVVGVTHDDYISQAAVDSILDNQAATFLLKSAAVPPTFYMPPAPTKPATGNPCAHIFNLRGFTTTNPRHATTPTRAHALCICLAY